MLRFSYFNHEYHSELLEIAGTKKCKKLANKIFCDYICGTNKNTLMCHQNLFTASNNGKTIHHTVSGNGMDNRVKSLLIHASCHMLFVP